MRPSAIPTVEKAFGSASIPAPMAVTARLATAPLKLHVPLEGERHSPSPPLTVLLPVNGMLRDMALQL